MPKGITDPEPARVRYARTLMERYYGEPIRPISHYCDAFTAWASALQEKREREIGPRTIPLDEDSNILHQIADMTPYLMIAIYKSAMLGRMIYGGEEPRERMCPLHKGVWSGLAWSQNDCPHGCQLTGWLPNEN